LADTDPQSLQGKLPEEASPEKTSSIFQRPKRIFVCCDGTGNEFAEKDSPDGNSNVVKFYTALSLGEDPKGKDCDQYAYYHPGVGTLGNPNDSGVSSIVSIARGLAFGLGFRENVLDAYRYLMQHYTRRDEVYIVGFSRGAYTARALAGLLATYGLLCRGNEGHLPYAWRSYLERTRRQKAINRHSVIPDTTFRDTFSHPDFSIRFVGLWDTVSSVGWVSEPMRLLDMAQNPTIQYGRHAISIDERRCFYQDNIWGEPVTLQVPIAIQMDPKRAGSFPTEQDLRQVWFPGVHSDVGESYPQNESGLANNSLEWMIDELRGLHVRFDEARVQMVLGKLPTARAHLPERDLSTIYEEAQTVVHRSLRRPWWLLEILPHRYYDKDDMKAERRIPFGAYRSIPPGSLIHPCVLEQLEDPCYRPRNLTLAELKEAPVERGTLRNGQHYLLFDPAQCRKYRWRNNGLVVYLVAVAEATTAIALAIYIASALVHILSRPSAKLCYHWIAAQLKLVEAVLQRDIWSILRPRHWFFLLTLVAVSALFSRVARKAS